MGDTQKCPCCGSHDYRGAQSLDSTATTKLHCMRCSCSWVEERRVPPAAQGAGEGHVAVQTAPETIWLQISDDEDNLNEPFPANEEVTWCADSVLSAQVKYVRADLCRCPPAAAPQPDCAKGEK